MPALALRAALAAALALTPAAAGADVADYLGRPIASIRFEIEGRPAADRGLPLAVETGIGEPLTMAAIRESISHLANLGRFEDVVVHAEAEAGGVGLLYALTPVHLIDEIAFAGSAGDGIDRGRLLQEIDDRFGALPPPESAPAMARLVEEALRVRGYLGARVTPTVALHHDPDGARLVLTLDAGVRARIAAIEVIEEPGVPPGALLDRLDIAVGDPYEPDDLSTRVEAYLSDRRSDDYYAARVTLQARFEDLDRAVHVSLTVSDGPRHRLVIAGDPLPSGAVDDLVPMAREGAADQDLLEDSTIRIEEYLRAQGYRDAVAPYSVEDAAGERVITFTVARGALYRVARVEIGGNAAVPLDDLRAGLQVAESRPFSAAGLDADVAALEDRYRQLGFAAVLVRTDIEPDAGAPATPGEMPLIVRLTIDESVRTIVGSVRLEGNASVPAPALLGAVGLQPDRPFVLAQMAIDRDGLQRYYLNLGFPRVSIDAQPGLSEDGARADVVFIVNEGPQLRVDDVIVIGNVRTRSETIVREVSLRSGDPLDATAILDSQQRLAALGLFRRVRITQLSHGDETTRDLVVSVEEAPATTIGYGGGVEAGLKTRAVLDGTAGERLEIAPRAFFEIGRRNLFGKNRSVSLFTRLSLRSDDPSTAGDPADEGSRFGFIEYRVLGTFREPRVFDSEADAFLTGTTEQQTRPSFNFARRAFSAEVARTVSATTGISGNYEIQRTELFDERFTEDARLIDRLFPQVRLSSFSGSAVRDTRDDQLNPARGHYASLNLQIAGRRIGSEVGFARTFVTTQLFRRLPGSTGIVLAASARLGIARGFPREIPQVGADGRLVIGADGAPVVDVVEDLPASERFFAGGDTTVRGFALDQLGTPATLDQDGFPLGGNAVAIFNAELRVPLVGGLGLVTFVDAGNVFARTGDVDLGELRGAVGFGVRYASPIGPIRVDLGFKADRRDLANGQRERLTALHVSLGQAF